MNKPSLQITWNLALLSLALLVVTYSFSCSSPPTTSCFRAGTFIATPQGSAPIESLRVGQKVFSYDLNHHKVVQTKVIKIWPTKYRWLRQLKLPSGRVLQATPEHPVYNAKTKRFEPFQNFKAGTHFLFNASAQTQVKTLVLQNATHFAWRFTKVYNIAVSGQSNFFAEGVLVHNKSLPLPKPKPEKECKSLHDCQEMARHSGIDTTKGIFYVPCHPLTHLCGGRSGAMFRRFQCVRNQDCTSRSVGLVGYCKMRRCKFKSAITESCTEDKTCLSGICHAQKCAKTKPAKEKIPLEMASPSDAGSFPEIRRD